MKSCFLVPFILLLCIHLNAQQLRGLVREEDSQQEIPQL